MSSRIKTILLIVFLIVLVYWGKTRPTMVGPHIRHIVTSGRCPACAHNPACSACGGFGTVEAQGNCPRCDGTGKHKWRFHSNPDAPCTLCRGTGKAPARVPCEKCGGSGYATCRVCRGTGVKSEMRPTTAIGNSPWEWLLLLLDIPIDPNPAPRRGLRGGYPLVERYLDVHVARPRARVREWGDFVYTQGGWRMVVLVDIENEPGKTTTREMEILVKDRLLVRCARFR